MSANRFRVVLLCVLLWSPVSTFSLSQQVASPTGIDYSYAGYRAGQAPIPIVRAALSVRPTGGDDTGLLQSAIDRVAAMPLGADGYRGAVVLRPGRFRVSGHLRIAASGVVLRGSGASQTTITAEGTGRRTLVLIGGDGDPDLNQRLQVSADAATGSRVLKVGATTGLKVGDRVVVRRPSTKEWISAIGMTGLPGTFANVRLDWQPGSHDLIWDRTVTRVRDGEIEVDAPITTALELKYGGGTVASISNPDALVRNVGVEELTLESSFATTHPKDEEHAWMAIALDHVEDAWVQHVTARHFVSAAVRVGTRARRVTVADCRSEEPVSEEGGYRRQAFLLYGQQVLVTRCSSQGGENDFASGLLSAGPNVFFDCQAKGSLGASGSFEGWSSGVLYENVRVPESRLQLLIDQERAQGAGWTAANSVIWNSEAKSIDVLGPPGGYNYKVESTASLYITELAKRGLKIWPESAGVHKDADAEEFHAIRPVSASRMPEHIFEVVNGHFVVDGKAVWGESQNEAWWRGDTSALTAARSTGQSITRFMPGQDGPGMTEVLPEFARQLKERGVSFYVTTPGLWYEHRRDAHNDFRQETGDVWAPFYEMPWARSGKGLAWDGLSLFDVSTFNPWFFERRREFIQQAAKQGIIVYVNLYNNHDVNEIGPHWIDFPFRPANNVNDTGINEPPPLRPNNRNDVADDFYNVDYAPLRKLHHDYIFQTLDTLGDQPNAIFTAAYQFAGPLKFEQFLQDTMAEWEKTHGRTVKLALVTGKNITDAILADPVRSKQVTVVDMRYWEYQPDGTLWAPDAGQNRAFRELISAHFPGYTDTPPPTTAEMMYRQVREYRDRYPSIALVPMENGAGPIPILMAGAASQSSLRGGIVMTPVVAPNPTGIASPPPRNLASGPSPAERRGGQQDTLIDKFIAEHLAADLMTMRPLDGIVERSEQNWVLGGGSTGALLIDARAGDSFRLSKPLAHETYTGLWFDPSTGRTHDAGQVSGRDGAVVSKPDTNEWFLLLRAR